MFSLYRHVATPSEADELARRYRSGSVGYREAKELLVAAHRERFAGATEAFHGWRSDIGALDDLLGRGAERARASAAERLAAVRRAVGLGGGDRRDAAAETRHGRRT